MRKNLLLGLILFLSLANASFACGCQRGFTATNGQKACQNIFAFFAIDFSFLSPRATAADVHVCGKHGFHKCCPPCSSECCPDSNCCPCVPECCPCQPQCSPCQPQCCPPQCCPTSQPKCSPYVAPFNRKSMITDEATKEMPVNNIQLRGQEESKSEIPVNNVQPAPTEENKNEVPICNKQTTSNPCANQTCTKNQKSMFRLDLFRTFKIQIL